MRLLQLHLQAFGPFAGETLDLCDGNYGLHLIYGPNEAGKSSSLRALRAVLFGVPERTTDAFLHPYDRLRVGARLEHSDGSVLEIVRRKGRSKDLLTPDGKAGDASELSRFLGGIEEELFKTLFGIDYEALVVGGEEILKGGGQLGQLLFAAGSGISDFRSVQSNLQEECDNLYRPNGKIPSINRALLDLRKQREHIKELQLASDDWRSRDQALTEARTQRSTIVADLESTKRSKLRLERLIEAQPLAVRRQRLLEELDEVRDAPILADDFLNKRRDSQAKLAAAVEQENQCRATLETLDYEVESIVVDEVLLEQADRIDDLYRRVGEFQKNTREKPILLQQADHNEAEARQLLRSLDPTADLSDVERYRMRPNEEVAMQNLANSREGLLARRDHGQEQRANLAQQLALSRRKLEQTPGPQDLSHWPPILDQASRIVHREEDLASQRAEVAHTEEQLARDVARLPLWNSSIDELLQLSVPPPDTIDRFDSEFRDQSTQADHVAQHLNDTSAKIVEVEQQLLQLEASDKLPTEDDVREARSLRDAGWQLVRVRWLEGKTNDAEQKRFVEECSGSDLPTAFENSVRFADEQVDRLRREADRVARKTELLNQLEKLRDEQASFLRQQDELKQSSAELTRQWSKHWDPAGIEPLPPSEMRDWLRTFTELVSRGEHCLRQRQRLSSEDKAVANQRERLVGLLKAVPLDTNAGHSLSELLVEAKRILAMNDELIRRREALSEQIEQIQIAAHEAERMVEAAHADVDWWQTQWSQYTSRLGLKPEATPAEANAVRQAVSRLFHLINAADSARQQVGRIDNDIHQFEEDTRLLAEQLGMDPSEDPSQTVEAYRRRLKSAQGSDQQRRNLCRQRESEADRLKEIEEKRIQHRSMLNALCSEAGCANIEQLPEAEIRSQKRKRLEDELRQLDEHFVRLCAAVSLEAFLAEAAATNVDAVRLELEENELQLRNLEHLREQVDQTIGAEQSALEQMDGNAQAAEAAEAAEGLLAQIHGHVERFLTLRLASGLLQRGIDRYREKNQEPVLRRSSTLFRQLTLDSFTKLEVDYDSDENPVLIGVRGNEPERVGVEGMSDGTRDQLFLALRLATLEAYLDKHEPLPFVVDDILLNFDDDRAAAALNVLAELSTKTQVLFFTHHQHLVELARSCISSDLLVTHSLRNPQPANAGSLF